MNYQRTARIIATLDCNRSCDYCVNFQSGVLEQAKPLMNLLDLRAYRAVCITGGEPTLYPDKLLRLITYIAQVNPRIKIYLYASDYTDVTSMYRIMCQIDGIHYTLHSNADTLDVAKFHALQDIIRWNELQARKSCRLTIFTGMELTLYLYPKVWTRIEKKPPDIPCPILDDEDLFLLSAELWSRS